MLAVISEPIKTGEIAYTLLVATCDGVTTKTFESLGEAEEELQAVKNAIAMGSGIISIAVVDAGKTEDPHAVVMGEYNRMTLQQTNFAPVLSWSRMLWNELKKNFARH